MKGRHARTCAEEWGLGDRISRLKNVLYERRADDGTVRVFVTNTPTLFYFFEAVPFPYTVFRATDNELGTSLNPTGPTLWYFSRKPRYYYRILAYATYCCRVPELKSGDPDPGLVDIQNLCLGGPQTGLRTQILRRFLKGCSNTQVAVSEVHQTFTRKYVSRAVDGPRVDVGRFGPLEV